MNEYTDKNGDIWLSKKEPNSFWINQRTKEESLFHPMALEIGNHVYRAYRRLKPTKGKKQ